MHKNKKACPPTRRGSALLLATILLFVILSMVVSLSYVTVMEQKMSQKSKSSVGSFYNAETGVEWALNQIATGSGDTISAVFGASATGAQSAGKMTCPLPNCEVYLLDEDGSVIPKSQFSAANSAQLVKAVRSVGSQGGETQRAIEAAVATGSGVSFTYYCFTNVHFGTPQCTDHGGDQGFCPSAGELGAGGLSGLKQKAALGLWSECINTTYRDNHGWIYPLPPGGDSCGDQVEGGPSHLGAAYVCSQ